jgi:uncharacterized repeat protein (TIGR01451 family)/MYXO-CTERM domain-containing protein
MYRSSLRGLLAGAALLVLTPQNAQAQTLRFSATAPGRVIATGNTLGLSKAVNQNGPGISDAIGTFLSLGSTADDMPPNPLNPWPPGTTYDWHQNGSTASLDLPSEGQVLYAELVWGGSYNYGGEDVTASLNTPVKLSAGAVSIDVMPDPATALTIAQTSMTGFAVNYYVRSADVTAFVQAAGSGMYAVSGVPATQIETINQLNAAGWTLAIALRNAPDPTRNLSVFVGGSFVDENTQQDYTVSGFCSPPAGVVNGGVVISAIEGDANLVGDQLLIAPTTAGPFVGLSGSNNPANNFFCSQVNDASGNVDMSGSFGLANHNAQGGVNISGGRQGWDVTTVALSSQAGQLQNGQTSAVLRTITTGDSYVPTFAAFAIDVNAPVFSGAGSMLSTSAGMVKLGDTLTVAVDLENTGQVTAQQVRLVLPLESGLSLASFQMEGMNGDINGNPVDAVALSAGVDAGDLAAGQTRHVVMDLDIAGPPAGTSYVLNPQWNYTFQVCTGGTNLSESFSQFSLVGFDSTGGSTGSGAGGGAGASGTGGAGNGGAGNGGASNGSGSGGAGNGGAGNGSAGAASGSGAPGDPESSGGCGCSLPGRGGGPSALGVLAVLAAAGLLRTRRRSNL